MCIKYEFERWDEENNVLVDSKPLLEKDHPVVFENTPWAYALNTAKGLYHKSKDKRFIDDDDLLFTTESGTVKLYSNVTVWPHYHYAKFMIVTLHDTKQTIIIDLFGRTFELDLPYIRYCYNRSVINDKENGCFLVDNSISIKYRTVSEQTEFTEKSKAISGVVFNKKYNSFVRANAKNTLPYLYLTGGNSKCGMFVDYFIANGMEYEIIPNMFCDDSSINIRVPLYGKNLMREDVQYLCAKYENTYAIYNVPITIAGGIFTPPSKLRTYIPNEKECLARSIYNTFCQVFSTTDKNKIFQKTIAKILKLFDKSSKVDMTNRFTNLVLKHPNDIYFNKNYFENEKAKVARLLSIDYSRVKIEHYYKAYELSKQKYREEINIFESEIKKRIAETGRPISRWKNESHLFLLTRQVYPDAIYQYHSSWLGRQSIDIFIPSISVGIEYQGEQHFRPIEFFGGEEAFSLTVKRDKQKEKLCMNNNVKLIYWRYDEVITVGKLIEKVEAMMNK